MRPTVHAEKHVVQHSLFAVASGAIANLLIARGLQTHVAASATNVREGSTISAVYVEMWVTSDDTAAGTCIITLEKVQNNATKMTAAQSAALDGYSNKRNIFHTQMGLIGPNTQYPMAVIKGWFKIPKGKQRFANEDDLVLNIHGQSNGMSCCGFEIFKEQY